MEPDVVFRCVLFSVFIYGFITLIVFIGKIAGRAEVREGQEDPFLKDFVECLKWPATGLRALGNRFKRHRL